MPYYDQPKVSSERNYTNIIKALKSNKVAYTDLYQLLSKDYEANQYYSLLPYDVKQALGYKADHILSFDDLHEFAMHCQEEE